MFDGNNTDFDIMMKSILESGEEQVPDRVWENISSSLDKAARRKKAFVIFRRSAICLAAAACLALGIFIGHKNFSPLPNPDTMIAVIPNSVHSQENNHTAEYQIIAESDFKKAASHDQTCKVAATADDFIMQTNRDEDAITTEQTNTEEVVKESEKTNITDKPSTAKPEENTELGCTDDIWEEEKPKNKIHTSIDFSGLASTNNSGNGKKKFIMKRPTLPDSPEKTGITDNSTKSTFGIPVSFGAAVKLEFTPKWAISIGARYTLLTRKFYGTYTKVDENGIVEWTESSDIRNSQHYVGVPLSAYYNIINRDFLKFYVRAGGAFEKCVADKYQVLSSKITHTEKVAGLQWSAEAGVGIEFAAGRHLGIYIDPSLRYYFPNKNQPKSLRTFKPLMLGFEAGLRVNF